MAAAMDDKYGVGVWYKYESIQSLPQLENHSASLVDGQKIFVFGGNSGNEQYNTLFDIDTHTMLMEVPATEGQLPRGRSAHTSTLYDQKLYILFGWGGTGNELHDLQCLDLRTFFSNRFVDCSFDGGIFQFSLWSSNFILISL
jgi:hypothetical protein